MKRICSVLLILALFLPLLSTLAEEAQEPHFIPQVLTQERFQELRERISSQISSGDERKFVRFYSKKSIYKCLAGDVEYQVLARHWLKQAAAMGDPYAEELLSVVDEAALSPYYQTLPDQLQAYADSHSDAAILEETFWVLSGNPRWVVEVRVQEFLSQIGYTEEEYAADRLWELPDEERLWIALLPDGNAAVVAYAGSDENVAIPATYRGCPVTQIAGSAFIGQDHLKTVEIPDTVTSIGHAAFFDCRSLTRADLPSSLTEIGRDAFWACNQLTEIAVPAGVSVIPSGAFAGCRSLNALILQEGLQTIEKGAFAYCHSSEAILLPNSVTDIAEDAFSYGSEDLRFIVYPDTCGEEFCLSHGYAYQYAEE